ncbi:PAS domain S-box protein [Pseudodesulfovibrio pelocollis]|uniref:PAS domain S-box protein n=1 Tax=Pseudodesulfovibrio pelocollis TaxID=3051432 RepID=UPI00255B2679|nr:transporter substrate-binding domain-containing protein [Pseudodesulfovibrio sp. SB368]
MPSRCRHLGVILTLLCLVWAMACTPAASQDDQTAAQPGTFYITAEERAWLDAHADLRLGMWVGSPPIVFRGSDGAIQGMAPAYMDIVTRKLGLKPRRVRASSLSALWELAKAGEVDMVGALPADPGYSDAMLISEPYLLLPIVIATRSEHPMIAGLDDLAGQVVAVVEGHIPQRRIPEDHPAIQVLPVASAEAGLSALVSGRAAAFVAGEATISHLAREQGIASIRIAAITEYSSRLSMGVRKDWPELLVLVNRALASITKEEREGIRDYWTVLRDSRWVERPRVWRMVGMVAAGAAFLLTLFFLWNRRLAREIERRKRAEAEYRRAHEATQRIIESADVIIVGLDYAGHVRLFNRAGEAVTGYSREELLGRNWFDLVVPRERFPFVWDEFSRLVNEGVRSTSDTFESPLLTKSGDTRHILWRNSVTGDGEDGLATISYGTDITHRLLAEEELRLTQFAVDNAAMGVLRIRPSGRIVYANLTAARMLGYTRGELKRKTVADVTREITREQWPELWERFKQNQVVTLETKARTRDDTALPVEVTAYHLLFKGTEVAIAFIFDITERKRVETLREDVERLVRHDLRSPTLAVQTLFTLFDRADNLTPDQRELLESVKQASRRMLNIIDMSRALYKMEAGTYTLSPVPVDLLAVASAVIEDLKPVLRSSKVSMAVNLGGEPTGPNNVFMVRAEELLCYALFSNLIKNAVEASPEGSTVTLDLRTADQHIVTVHNTGAIPEAIRDSFFEKYVTSDKIHGTGLGTYTAKLVTTALGGTIDFTTSEEEGTTMTVRLPVRHAADPHPGNDDRPTAQPRAEDETRHDT